MSATEGDTLTFVCLTDKLHCSMIYWCLLFGKGTFVYLEGGIGIYWGGRLINTKVLKTSSWDTLK